MKGPGAVVPDPSPATAAQPAGSRAGDGRGHGRRRVLVARLDEAGDVLLAGPAVRAVRAAAREVVMLAGPRGREAAELLPGVDRVIEWRAPWIDHDPPPVDADRVGELLHRVRGVDEALILTSFHQSALPLALLLRLAGVRRIAAISETTPARSSTCGTWWTKAPIYPKRSGCSGSRAPPATNCRRTTRKTGRPAATSGYPRRYREDISHRLRR